MVFRRVARRAAGAYLALVLVLAPLMGLMHGVTHGGMDPGHATAAHLLEGDDGHGHAQGWLADLFSAHGDDSDCRVYDQLSHGDAAPVLPLVALPLALSAFVFLFLQGETLARRAALFEARGPPLTR